MPNLHPRLEPGRGPLPVRTGNGPANLTRLRCFAIGLIKSKSDDSVAATIEKLARKVRRVFDDPGMSGSSIPRMRCPAPAG